MILIDAQLFLKLWLFASIAKTAADSSDWLSRFLLRCGSLATPHYWLSNSKYQQLLVSPSLDGL
jgi:hypothetical protein